MSLPTPEPGLVIQYGYVWRHEAEREVENARYPRPCAIVVARRLNAAGETEVLVVPFTHRPPTAGRRAVELPSRTRAALGLPVRTWAITDELNVFTWPGFDLARNAQGEFAWGQLPSGLLDTLRRSVLDAVRAGDARPTPR